MIITRRGLEVGTAALTGAFGAAVVASSLEHGIGWSSAGVDAGTFPFLTGALILAGSLFNLVAGWLGSRRRVIDGHDLKKIGGLFLPALAYVAVIPLIGMHVASALYLLATLTLQKHMSPLRALALAVVTAISLYVLFDWMFQVTLPRGLLGDALGF
jgi:Tripartite tricarboxylate transporter TctB family